MGESFEYLCTVETGAMYVLKLNHCRLQLGQAIFTHEFLFPIPVCSSYVTVSAKTVLIGTFSITRKTNLKYSSCYGSVVLDLSHACQIYSITRVVTVYRESFAKENFRNMLIVSVHEKAFVNLVIQLKFLVINKKYVMQENVRECTKTCKICERFLSRMVLNMRYLAIYCSITFC